MYISIFSEATAFEALYKNGRGTLRSIPTSHGPFHASLPASPPPQPRPSPAQPRPSPPPPPPPPSSGLQKQPSPPLPGLSKHH